MAQITVFLVVFFSGYAFYLFPWVHIPGVFNITDLGLLVIIVACIYILSRSKDLKSIVWNFSSFLVILYLLMILATVSIASIYYDQSVLDGIIGIRDQFYYLAFFVFSFITRSDEALQKILKLFGIIALFIVAISLINYFAGIKILHHRWSEGHGIRSGVTRAWIPAITVLAVALFWNFSLLNNRKRRKYGPIFGCIVFFGAFVFRQTRGHLIGIIFAVFGTWFLEKKFTRLLVSLLVIVPLIFTIDIVTIGILSNLISTAASDMSDATGNWAARLEQVKFAMKLIAENPLFGSGVEALRQTEGISTRSIRALIYKADLGYISFVKAYGLIGALWLLMFFIYIFRGLFLHSRGSESTVVYTGFYTGYMLYVFVSFITINHFMYPLGIVCLTFVLAVFERTQRQLSEDRRISGKSY